MLGLASGHSHSHAEAPSPRGHTRGMDFAREQLLCLPSSWLMLHWNLNQKQLNALPQVCCRDTVAWVAYVSLLPIHALI
jgi:hypothetical protein